MRRILLCLLVLAQGALAEVYTYVDAAGNRVFTDKPGVGNAQRVTIAPSNSMSLSPPGPAPTAPPNEAPAPAPSYQLLRILLPEPDASVRDSAGNLLVTAISEPGLHPGHGYRLLVDGQVIGEPGRSPVFTLENLDRGTHQLAVEIVDAQGRIVERTPSQPLHMLRISLAQKRQANPCRRDDYGVRPECPLKDKPAQKRDIPFVPFL
ncbi:DUF4124 domain-containing protein [Pseudomonas zhanjiangensis]|uniref:DUF4124 domain-containing protein n=1 Tax=Pseudomonas zhanjiangensis TaxID=3239015 RepID=A0ABV3YX24_9PSED